MHKFEIFYNIPNLTNYLLIKSVTFRFKNRDKIIIIIYKPLIIKNNKRIC